MTEKLSESDAASSAGEAVQLRSRPPKLDTWSHIGVYADVLKLRAGAFTRCVRCPRCKRMKHPNVTSDRDKASGRHCNHCLIRWDDDTRSSTWAIYGSPDGVVKDLIDALLAEWPAMY